MLFTVRLQSGALYFWCGESSGKFGSQTSFMLHRRQTGPSGRLLAQSVGGGFCLWLFTLSTSTLNPLAAILSSSLQTTPPLSTPSLRGNSLINSQHYQLSPTQHTFLFTTFSSTVNDRFSNNLVLSTKSFEPLVCRVKLVGGVTIYGYRLSFFKNHDYPRFIRLKSEAEFRDSRELFSFVISGTRLSYCHCAGPF